MLLFYINQYIYEFDEIKMLQREITIWIYKL